MNQTPRFQFPFILPGQAQKELYHNEALALLDLALHAAAEGVRGDPPDTPEAGDTWIVAPAATGEWAGKPHFLACWTGNGWRFLAPTHGMHAWSKTLGHWIYFDGVEWNDQTPVASVTIGGKQVVGPRGMSIATPSGGTIIDQEARVAITAVIEALMSHGLIE